MRIFIVITVFKRLELTAKCLESLNGQSIRDFEIIVVDHCEEDNDTASYLAKYFPNVHLIKGNNNMWWTGATNAGISYVIENLHPSYEDDFILTLNNDLTVREDYLECLIEAYQSNKPCLIGSLSVDSQNPEKIDFAGCKWNKVLTTMRDKFNESVRYSDIVDIKYINSDLLPGRGMLIPFELIQKIGMFDEVHFPHYVSDYDFSYRALISGYKLLVSTKSVVYSDVQQSGTRYDKSSSIKPSLKFLWETQTSQRSPISIKNRYRWAQKHTRLSKVYFAIDTFRIIVSYSIYSAKFFLKKDS